MRAFLIGVLLIFAMSLGLMVTVGCVAHPNDLGRYLGMQACKR